MFNSMLKIVCLMISGLLLTGCGGRAIDFGCKMAAVHRSYDSMIEIFEREYAKEDERKYIDENPVRASYYYRILGICESFRTNKDKAEKAFSKSLAFADNPLTHYHLAKFALRERDIESAEKHIKAMENAIAKKIWYDVNYYEFLLTGLRYPQYKELIKNKTTIESFYIERCNFLKQTLENVRKMPPDILPALHNIKLKNADKIRYGMKFDELENCLGKYEYKTEGFRGDKNCFYPLDDKLAVCFMFSANGRLGDITFCQFEKISMKRRIYEAVFLPNSVYAIQWRLN